MLRTLMNSRRTAPLAAIGALTALALATWSCGGSAGTTGYSNPITTTKTDSAIIDAATLAKWTDEGKVNAPLGTADRVVVVSVASLANFTSTTKKHIPDAVLLDYANELTMTREEGLGPRGTLMLSGPRMDALVQKLGIDGSTTVVLTIPRGSSDGDALPAVGGLLDVPLLGLLARPREDPERRRRRLGRGGPAADRTRLLVPTASTYTVSGNKVLKDVLRTSVGEMLDVRGLGEPGPQRPQHLADARRAGLRHHRPTSPTPTAAAAASSSSTDRVNGEATRNRLYPDRTTLVSRMAASPVLDGTAQTFLSPGKKMLVMCGTSTSASPTFVLFDAVLGVPEGDITMYDGSSSQWNNYSVARIRQAGATAAQAEHLGVRRRHPRHLTPRARSAPCPRRSPARTRSSRATSPSRRPRARRTRPRPPTRPTWPRRRAGSTPGGGGGGSTGGGC